MERNGEKKTRVLFSFVFFLFMHLFMARGALDYRDALEKSLLYFEAQRSGHLPYNQRVMWRGHSGLTDGLEQGVDLVGGYYDAGDNVKFGLPMAFTITMLSWSVLEYGDEVKTMGEIKHALEAIKWGTDYFIKAHTEPNVLWAQVGDGDVDHYCWQRPEDMTTSRHAYKIDKDHPGSELAAETAAAMAAASIVFKQSNPHYSHLLLHHAQQLFEFADKYRGKYDESVSAVKSYYPSHSGYGDELLWAALWLHRGTHSDLYLQYIVDNADEFGGTGWAVSEFSWDIKYAGLQVLASKLLMEGRKLTENVQNKLEEYRSKAEYYLCSCLGKNTDNNNVQLTPGGLLYIRQWNNLQYVTGATFLLTAFSDYLLGSNQQLKCPTGLVPAQEVFSFAKTQADYILGSNPNNFSYLVGFGPEHPKRVHHRGASTIAYKKDDDFIGCTQGYDAWHYGDKENPNELTGAIVGGPNLKDEFKDSRGNYVQTEACTYNTAPMVGIFAKLNQLEKQKEQQQQQHELQLIKGLERQTYYMI
ncbi:hypothetical protein LUZ60_008749 [Juncus effusus]|nr:hypothetical protein LUZ60_008749 [Juncus effusus]